PKQMSTGGAATPKGAKPKDEAAPGGAEPKAAKELPDHPVKGEVPGGEADNNTASMSDAETRQMSGSLDKLPTTASDVSTDTGPPPELKMKGEAKGSTDKDRADLETKTTQLQIQGRADARVPMGEDHIETTVPTEELTAAAVPGGAVPDAQLPTVDGAAATEEAGFVAQEHHGAEIDAALAKASG